MQTVFGFDALGPNCPESTVCIGVFDGMHLGHQAIVREAVIRARAAGRPCIAVTFDRNPLAVVAPERCPKSISSVASNLSKMSELGLDCAVVAVFDADFSRLSAKDFFDEFLLKKLRAAEIVVGHDFAFGNKRVGNASWLVERIPTVVLPALEIAGSRVSSSLIRGLIAEGRIAVAREMLGANYALTGIVVRGQRLGTKLGVPTANVVQVIDQVTPALGIYAGFARVECTLHPAAISVGKRPTIPGAGYAIEAHLLDFPYRELYGHSIEVQFLDRLRDEQAFDSVEDLKNQMDRDISEARLVLAHHG